MHGLRGGWCIVMALVFIYMVGMIELGDKGTARDQLAYGVKTRWLRCSD